jgi:hypothetical protein
LHDGEPRANGGDRTWAYHLGDGSTQALRALVNDPSIEDTGRIDRSRLRVEEPLSMRAWHALPTPWQWLPGLLHAANGQAWLYYMFRLLPLIAVAVLAAGLVGGTLPSRAMVARVASLVTFCLLLNLFIMREPVTARFGAMAGPAAVLSLWLSLQAWQVGVGGRRLAARAMTVLLATVTVWAISVSSSWRELLTARLLDPSHLTTTLARMASSPPSDELLPTGRRAGLVRYLRECTEPTDRVLVAWFAPEVYFFAQRPFAAHMVVFFGQHWSEPRFADVSARDLSTQGAAIVVSRTGDQSFGETYSTLARVLEERYELAGTTSFGDPEMPEDGYTVLVPRGRPAIRKDGEFHLPCFR